MAAGTVYGPIGEEPPAAAMLRSLSSGSVALERSCLAVDQPPKSSRAR